MSNLAKTLKAKKEARAAALGLVKTFSAAVEAGTFKEDTDAPALEAAQRSLEQAETEVERVQNLMNIQNRAAGWNGDGDGDAKPTGGDEGDEDEGRQTRSAAVIKRMKKDANAAKDFRLHKFLLGVATGNMEGLEREMSQEGQKECREAQLDAQPGYFIPGFIARPQETQQRAMVVGTATAGGHTVATNLGELIPFLDPRLSLREMGAVYLPNLQGNLDIPRKTARGRATWATEVATSTEITPTFDKPQMSPKRLTAFLEFSLQLLTQSSLEVENMSREDLNNAVSLGLEYAGLMGAGTSTIPAGIIAAETGTPALQSGVNAVALGTNGAIPAWADIVNFETKVSEANALMGKCGYITTPGMAGLLKTLKRDVAGNGFVWEGRNDGSGTVNGYKAMASTIMPKVLVKGTSGAACHAIFFGNWADMVIGQWGGLNIVVDPYTQAKDGKVVMTVNSFFDIALRHAASFAACVDAKIA